MNALHLHRARASLSATRRACEDSDDRDDTWLRHVSVITGLAALAFVVALAFIVLLAVGVV